jgi:hypothetical protein
MRIEFGANGGKTNKEKFGGQSMEQIGNLTTCNVMGTDV